VRVIYDPVSLFYFPCVSWVRTWLICLLLFRCGGEQLDFEDENPEDDEGQSSESEHEEQEESGSEGDQFEDAMEKLVISDAPAVSVSTWMCFKPYEW
jgi:diphthamide biosynthesis protein 3